LNTWTLILAPSGSAKTLSSKVIDIYAYNRVLSGVRLSDSTHSKLSG